MNFFLRLRHHSGQAAARFFALIARRWSHKFYLCLAAIFSLFVLGDAAVFSFTADMRQAAFDAMMRNRLLVPRPDPEIVIVDIDEASLAAMSKEYGRWPWPRLVLGEFLEHLEAQRPRAVVFDILFSDPDVYNPDSDAYFDAAVATTTNTFFPILRLSKASDALSHVAPSMIPGAIPIAGLAQTGATVAVVLPHMPSAVRGGRLGFHNLTPDPDGVVREYLVYRDDYGWRIPSLPARVVGELGYPVPARSRVLLNWRGKPFTYRTVSFSDVFEDMLSKKKRRAPDEFANKIVLIGSTAPSLFDVKPTPMSQLHPGVEILATAIDNLKRGDYLRYQEDRGLYTALTLLIVWAIAWGFYRSTGRGTIDRLFGVSQFILLGVSYASLNLSSTYINLTGPVTVALAYFTVARTYAAATSRALEASALRLSLERTGDLLATLLLVRVAESENARAAGALAQIRALLEQDGTEPKSVESLRGRQKGIWSTFQNTVVVSWVVPADDRAARDRVGSDVRRLTAALEAMAPLPTAGSEGATWFVHEGLISGGTGARGGWRTLFAEAQLLWHRASTRLTGSHIMNLTRVLAALLATSLLAMGPALAGDAGVVLRATDLKGEPFRDAKTVGALDRGDAVEILDRQGGWFRVKRARSTGWVRMLSVRRGEARKGGDEIAGVLGLASGRAGTGQVVSATGIRGLSEEQLKAATFDEAEVERLEAFTTTPAAAAEFAAQGKLMARPVPYLPAPESSPGERR